jgi:hypothetical protein
MRVRVLMLRRNGRRQANRGEEGIAGDLSMHAITLGSEIHKVARLCARMAMSSKDEDLLPALYAPELVAIGEGSLLLRGFESSDGAGHVQEWHCVLE